MKKRVRIQELEPAAYQAMFGLEKYLNQTDLEKNLRELIKIRASQLNGCAYCIDMHTQEAMELGETHRRIFALSAWRESPLFTERERVALRMTDEITRLGEDGLSESTYAEATRHFSDREIAQVIMQISVINVWTRIAVSTHMQFEG